MFLSLVGMETFSKKCEQTVESLEPACVRYESASTSAHLGRHTINLLYRRTIAETELRISRLTRSMRISNRSVLDILDNRQSLRESQQRLR